MILPFGFAHIIDLQTAQRMLVMKFGWVSIQAPADVSGAVHVVVDIDIGVTNGFAQPGSSWSDRENFRGVAPQSLAGYLRRDLARQFIQALSAMTLDVQDQPTAATGRQTPSRRVAQLKVPQSQNAAHASRPGGQPGELAPGWILVNLHQEACQNPKPIVLRQRGEPDAKLLGMVPRRFKKPAADRFGGSALPKIDIIRVHQHLFLPGAWGRDAAGLGFVSRAAQCEKAWSSAHEEKACFALSPHAGFPITRTAHALIGVFKEQVKVWPGRKPAESVAVAAG